MKTTMTAFVVLALVRQARAVLGAVFLSLMLSAGGSARAGVILQDTTNNFYCLCGATIAQTFTAEDANIQSIAFRIGDVNAHLGSELEFTATLFEGVGFGGTNLGSDTRSFVSLTDVTDNAPELPEFQDFDFSGALLTVGNVYTVLIGSINERGGVRTQTAGDPYPGGDWLAGGGVLANQDLVFRVTPIPEPSALTLAAFTLLALACGRRKRR